MHARHHRPPRSIALWLPAGGGVASVTLPSAKGARIDLICTLVGGPLLTWISLDAYADMWINQDLGHDPPNLMATRVAGAHGHDLAAVHGPAVLTGGVDANGFVRDLDDTTATLLASVAFYRASEGPLRPDEIDGHRSRDQRRRGDPGDGVAPRSI